MIVEQQLCFRNQGKRWIYYRGEAVILPIRIREQGELLTVLLIVTKTEKPPVYNSWWLLRLLVAGVGFEPTTFGLCLPLRLLPLLFFKAFVVWTIPSSTVLFGGACRLVSTPFPRIGGLGSVLPFQVSPTLTGYHSAVTS